ncbi:GNAT family N-acetyltransferase [Halorubrum sp. AS12]|uniref:GNAT family N-acetyltransferase n=1 Tax=Halorubrum sp. AS12 TaxID=3409687 RepID=UPI003DA70C80
MPRDLTTRRASPSDAAQIYQVMRRSRNEAFGGILPPAALDWDAESSDGFREFVRATVAHEEKVIVVAVSDATVVGVAELSWESEDTAEFVEASEAELKAIHVRPAEWNEGIGTGLIEKAVATLPADVSGVACCVLVENQRARAFYERRGFERTGTTTTTHAGDRFTEAVYRRPRETDLRDG